MTQPLRILAPTRYPWTFNGPRDSRHAISRRDFVPFNKISAKIEGITIINPLPPQLFDLIHAFNRIPLGRTPYIIGFESHLPRGFGVEHTAFFRAMSHSLAGNRCRGIFAISEYARRQCLHQHQHFPWYDTIQAKLVVRYPNLPMPEMVQDIRMENGPLRLLFVGNHFARKGGLVALRMAELAHERGIPLQLEIISALEFGAASWTDPLTPGYFEHYRALMQRLPNVTHHGALPNAQVIARVANAHFTLLPTFSDSFGFSAIESMAHATPVIATAQCALPEFVTDGENGILLPLAVDAQGEWADSGRGGRSSASYAALYDATVMELAKQALARIDTLMHAPPSYARMRERARHTAQSMFTSSDANDFWDGVYEQSVMNHRT